MANYSFLTLNDKDFEELSRDLLNKKLTLNLQDFKKGKDQGIDLRYSTPIHPNEVIVQAKHYYSSGYTHLVTALKKEVEKVKKLSPTRYIIVTSVPLSAKNQTEIKELFAPLIRDENDVIGNETLNAWLESFPEVQKAHFKLWMSSVSVIESILNRAVIGRSVFYSEEIKEKISLYVPTNNLSEALKTLDEKRVLIISGEPGIGKSTLAEILCLRLMSEGFNLFKIETIKEAEDVFSYSQEEKQIFYFDDFLGSIYLEFALISNNTDSHLNSFIQRIRKTPNKLLLFTSRTVILNQALTFYEKFRKSYSEKESIEVKLKDYTNYDKAKILYNHIYFRKLDKKYLDVLYNNDFFLNIIKHPNYNPRTIDFISDSNKITDFSAEQYKNYIVRSLANPTEIWETSFFKQINNEQRFLLTTLFSFSQNVADEEKLEEACNARLTYEINHNGHTRASNSFINSIRILLNGFIRREIVYNLLRNSKKTVSYINPSLADFIKNNLINSKEERLRVFKSCIYFEQFDKLIEALKDIQFSLQECEIVYTRLQAEELKFIELVKMSDNAVLLKKIKYLLQVVNGGSDHLLTALFNPIDWEGSFDWGKNELVYLLNYSKKVPSLFQAIKSNFQKIILCVISNLDSPSDYEWLKELFEEYNVSFDEFKSKQENQELLFETFQFIMDSYVEEKIEELKANILAFNEAEDLEQEFYEIASDIDLALFEDLNRNIDININVDWDKHISSNNQNDAHTRIHYDYDDYKERRYFKVNDEESAIRNLFDRN